VFGATGDWKALDEPFKAPAHALRTACIMATDESTDHVTSLNEMPG